MAEAAAGKSKLGIPKKVGAEFMSADPGGKLPERKTEKMRGLHSHPRSKKRDR